MELQVEHVSRYEAKELASYVIKTAREKLTAEELDVLDMRFFGDMTQDEVSNVVGKSKMWVSRQETSALKKLRKLVL